MMANKEKVQAAKVAAVESLSTVKSSEAALARKADRKANNEAKQAADTKRPDIRDREDIDKAEAIDRFSRELAKVDGLLSFFRAKKRALLQAILAMRQGLPMPDKKLLKLKDEELEGQTKGFENDNVAPKKKSKGKGTVKPPVEEKDESEKPAEADAEVGGGSSEDQEDVPGADPGDGSLERPE